MKQLPLAITLIIALLSTGCREFTKTENKEIPVARVNDHYLYKKDLRSLVSRGVNPEDSIKIVQNYIQNWIRDRLLLEKAITYLPEDQAEIENKVEEYRNALIIYMYEKALIKQKLDTVVSMNEIREYYMSNLDNFTLKENIYRLMFVKTVNDAPRVDSVKRWLEKGKKAALVDYCNQFGITCLLNDSMWYEQSRVLYQLPLSESELLLLATKSTPTLINDSSFIYLVLIKDMKRTDEESPIGYVMEDIKKIILNKRRIELISSTYDKIYKEAVESGSFEIYQNP